MNDLAGRPVGWGFVGAGGVARRQMLPALVGLPEVRLAALMVRDRARAEAIAAEFGVATAYASVEGLLADPTVEAVYLATPVATHRPLAEAALAAGKAVLLEKPMALTVAEAAAIAAAAEAAGRLLAVCFPLRHNPAVRLLREVIAAGELGRPLRIEARLEKWYPLDESAWRADPRQAGGGVVMDLGSHLLDVVEYLAGPVETVATATLETRHWPIEVEDTATLELTLASGRATVGVGFATRRERTLLAVSGPAGEARWPVEGGVAVTCDGRTEIRAAPPSNVYRAEVLDFSAALRAGRPAATTGRDGVRNLELLAAVYEAARR